MFFQPFPSFLPFVSYPRSRQDVENDEAEIAMDIEEWTLGTLVQSYGPVSVLNNFFQYLNNRVRTVLRKRVENFQRAPDDCDGNYVSQRYIIKLSVIIVNVIET